MFDIIVIATVVILTIMGFWKGMLRQIFGLLGIIAGYLLAMRFYEPLAKYMPDIHLSTAKGGSFIAILLASMLIASILGWAAGSLSEAAKLGTFNRIGGGILGFVKGCIIVCVAVMVLEVFFPADSSGFKKSVTYGYIKEITDISKHATRWDIDAKYKEKVGKEDPAPSKPGRQ
jgi:membrane protein required for colicin V production